MASMFRNLLYRLRIGRSFVGRDLEGNKFYEYPPAQPDSTRTKRQVKYVRGVDAYSYATGLTRLPAQWTAWLSHTRMHPPTLEELQADLARRHRVTALAAQIQARDDEEHARQIATNQLASSIQPPQETAPKAPEPSNDLLQARPEDLRTEARQKTQREEPHRVRPASASGDAPESWNPSSVRRRG